jgi:hypothetical protein
VSKHIATTFPVAPGWRVMFYVVNASGSSAMSDDGTCAVREVPIDAWGALLRPSHIGAVASSFNPPMGSIELVPLGLMGQRLDMQPGYIGTIPPGETIEQAIERIGEPVFRKGAKPVRVGAR